MDAVRSGGVEIIRSLQEQLHGYERTVSALEWYQSAYSQTNVIRYLVPLLYVVSPWAAFKLALSIAVTGNLCMIAKWSFRGIRPYWYSYYSGNELKSMPQFCEASYGWFPCSVVMAILSDTGTPSCYTAHATVTAVILTLTAYEACRNLASKKKTILGRMLSGIFAFSTVSFMWIARLHSAQSYSFQMGLGVILGMVISLSMGLLPFSKATRNQLIALPPFLAAWYYSCRYILRLFKVPIDTVLHMTQGACANPDNVVDNERQLWINTSILAALVIVLELVKTGPPLTVKGRAVVGVLAVIFGVTVGNRFWSSSVILEAIAAPLQLVLLLFWVLPLAVGTVWRLETKSD